MRVSPCSVTILSRLKTDCYATGVERNPEHYIQQFISGTSKEGGGSRATKKEKLPVCCAARNYFYLTSVKESRCMPIPFCQPTLFRQ
ncbi:MAG: hypothetical protein D3908_17150, partial [Candidatus Electrothrix sp. AUS4]|nr:hypothetical protein [Candidatus Electrothrix sp. AUS4]